MYVCLRCLLLPILFVENVDDVAYISPKQVELVSNEHWEKELNWRMSVTSIKKQKKKKKGKKWKYKKNTGISLTSSSEIVK